MARKHDAALQTIHTPLLDGCAVLARDIIAAVFALTVIRKSRSGRDDGSASSPSHELRLLPAWPDPFEVFTENLSDRIRGRVVPVVETSSEPDHGFWRNIDLHVPFPQRGLRDSVFVHTALLGVLYVVSIWPQARVHLADSRSYRTTQNAFLLSPYLPELHGAPTRHRHWGKADPVLAGQEIRSLPDEPDNLRQTIVAPPKLKLQHDVELPNLVAYEPTLPQPLDASSHSAVPHPPEVVAPATEIVQIKPLRALPKFQPSVVVPAPSVGSISRRGALNLVQLVPSGPAPVLPAPPEIVQLKSPRALPSLEPRVIQPAPSVSSVGRGSALNLAQLLPSGPAPVLPSPPVGNTQAPQVLALSLHPAEVQAPVPIPDGTRRGAFAASPTGHANATGAPGAEDSSGISAHDASRGVNAPAGISVGASPLPAAAVAAPKAPSPKPPVAAEPDLRAKLLAAMRPPMIASIPPRPPVARETTGKQTELENHIFAGRRSYTLAVNTPNLNAAAGSWIIHYVDREQGLVPSPITPPEVVSKFDPGYPAELFRDGVHGTVVLTAIIRADGSVSDIAVAQSLNTKLDQNAMQAFSRWVFRPALKNGQPIDLQAVILVPFRTK